MAPSTKVNGLMAKPMAKELKPYQMELFTMDYGMRENSLKVNASTQMEKSMKENGKMENLKEEE